MFNGLQRRILRQKAVGIDLEDAVVLSSNLTTLIERLVKEEVQKVFLNLLSSGSLDSLLKPNQYQEHSSDENFKADHAELPEDDKPRKYYEDHQEYDTGGRFREHYAEPDKYSKYLSFQLPSSSDSSYYYQSTKRPSSMRNPGYGAKYASSSSRYDKKYYDAEILAYLDALLKL